MKEIIRGRVLGVPIDKVDMSSALEFVSVQIQNNKKGSYILAVNAEKIMSIQKDSFLRTFFENAALLLPDGIGIVLAIRWILGLEITRVTGVDLMQNLCKEAVKKGYKIFIYGGTEEVNKDVVEKIKNKYPGILVVGRSNGYLEESRMNYLINKINESDAEILFIALGSPKQEMWIQKYLPQLNINICQAIGGTLDVISGKTKRASKAVQKIGLEWLYRLINEPKRIHRQIVYPVFLIKILIEKFRKNNLTYLN